MAVVRGTMKDIKPIEVNIDTVYIRSNIKKVEEDDFVGWEYNEEQIPLKEYISTIDYLGLELSKEKTKNLQKDSVINSIGKELTQVKLELLKLRGGDK